jgi:hypothetical protein
MLRSEEKLPIGTERQHRIIKQYICKIVDVGSAVFRQAPQPGRLGDLTFLGVHRDDILSGRERSRR